MAMSRKTGKEACNEIIKAKSDTRAFFASCYAGYGIGKNTLLAGAVDTFMKPNMSAELLKKPGRYSRNE